MIHDTTDEMRWRMGMYGSSEESARDAAIEDVICDEYDIEPKY